MRKGFLWIILLALFLCSCANPARSGATNSTETTPVGSLAEQADINTDPEILECETAADFVTLKSIDTGIPCPIRLTKNPDQKEPTVYNLCIEIDTGTEVLKKELATGVIPLPEKNILYFGDVDGNGIQEIFVHHNTGGVGGFGLWQTWVLKVEGNEILIVFENFNAFDTGFESRFLEEYQLEVKNRFTGYTLIFDVNQAHKDYIANSKELPDGKILLDPFFVFEPKDVDSDGISEILCKQYTSILSHADYTGTACSVLKFNNKTQVFEVIDAWYEPNTEQ